jgi:hypothetical protein
MKKTERTAKRKTELAEAKKKKTEKLLNSGKNPNCCEMCGRSSFVSDHHIIKKQTDNYKYNSVVENLLRVCQKCHKIFHAFDSNKLYEIKKDWRFYFMYVLFRQRK